MSLWKSLEERIQRDEPLSKHTSFGVGGTARFFFLADSIDSLKSIRLYCEKERIKWTLIGAGTNLLVADEGYAGCVIKLGRHFDEIMPVASGFRAGAATKLAGLVNRSCEMGFEGLECLAGIPGSVGGAVRMNAGGKYGYIGDYVSEVHCLTSQGDEAYFSKKEIKFEYRSSNLDDYIILSADFALQKGNPEKIKSRMHEIIQQKLRTQPTGDMSAGCVFKNPPEKFAGELIEKAGLKGAKIGGAFVSPEHANYIINDGSARARDIFELIGHVQKKVKDAFGIELELEIKVIR